MVFVLPEDAVRALNEDISIRGRKVAVSVADKKPRKRDNYKSKHEEYSGKAFSILLPLLQASSLLSFCQAWFLYFSTLQHILMCYFPVIIFRSMNPFC